MLGYLLLPAKIVASGIEPGAVREDDGALTGEISRSKIPECPETEHDETGVLAVSCT